MPQSQHPVTSGSSDDLIFETGLCTESRNTQKPTVPWVSFLQNAREEGKVIASHIKVLFILK